LKRGVRVSLSGAIQLGLVIELISSEMCA